MWLWIISTLLQAVGELNGFKSGVDHISRHLLLNQLVEFVEFLAGFEASLENFLQSEESESYEEDEVGEIEEEGIHRPTVGAVFLGPPRIEPRVHMIILIETPSIWVVGLVAVGTKVAVQRGAGDDGGWDEDDTDHDKAVHHVVLQIIPPGVEGLLGLGVGDDLPHQRGSYGSHGQSEWREL